MGRHSAPKEPPPERADRAAPDGEMVGWAVFSVPLTVLSLGIAGAGWWFAIAVGFLMALVFAAVVYAIGITGSGADQSGDAPADVVHDVVDDGDAEGDPSRLSW